MGILKSQKTINKVVLLPISDISASPFQPRRHFDRNAMEELARSIEANGLLQPVTVKMCIRDRIRFYRNKALEMAAAKSGVYKTAGEKGGL